MAKQGVRCAIYTRKSSEEGLEQSFNSLEAQREACHAFITSQKHEGWTALSNHYDDGGFSGGTMERPGLKQLLEDVRAAKVDNIIVYKVDRLTRSLTDFAKMIEILDSHKVSFVSVTQQFNTTSSMGRLTLNVLLSFAQFEREITGERIRDKIAASKQKGMWMGGTIPLGYDCVDRRLVVNQVEARTVRQIFRIYLRLGCVRKLRDFLDRKQMCSKIRKCSTGKIHGGASYSRGALYHLLSNRIYIGEVVHRGQSYPGQHRPVVPRKLWDKIAASLQENNQAHRTGKSSAKPSLLSGKLFDTNGIRFTPTHAVKNSRRYRYYTSQTTIQQSGIKPAIARFPAEGIEQFVKSQVHLVLQTPEKCISGMRSNPSKDAAAEQAKDLAKTWSKLEISRQHDFLRNILRRVVIGQTAVWIEIDKIKLVATLLKQKSESVAPLFIGKANMLKLTSEFKVLRRRGELRVIPPEGGAPSFEGTRIPSLVKAVARAHNWYEQIIAGEIASVRQLAQKSNLTRRYVRRILQCANLSPKITEAILIGKQPPDLRLKEIQNGLPLDWREQEAVLAILRSRSSSEVASLRAK